MSEREKLLLELMKLDLAVQDSALFLDLRPKDSRNRRSEDTRLNSSH